VTDWPDDEGALAILDEMCDYVELTRADRAELAGLWKVVEPRLDEIPVRFYDRIRRLDAARRVFESEAQVERPQATLKVWLREMLCGPHDADYVRLRRKIGYRHVAVGLPHRFMYLAMQVVEDHIAEMAYDALPPQVARRLCSIARRMCMVDLTLMTGTYMDERSGRQLASLQELLVSHLPMMVVLTDDGGRPLNATPSVVGLWKGEEPSFCGFPAPVVQALLLRQRFEEAMVTRMPQYTPRLEVELAGETKVFGLTLIPLDGSRLDRGKGKQAAMLVYLEDHTRTVGMEAALHEQAHLAQLGEMSAAVAHELRNPLAGISGAVQVIVRTLDEGDRRKQVMQKVVGQIHRLNEMVRDLLAFSRTQDVANVEVDLAAVGAEVRDLRASSEAHQHARNVVGEGQGRAMGDVDLLHRVVLNLVENSFQAGASQVRIRVSPGELRVIDDGEGIDPDVAEKLFMPFVTTRVQGTGLGLAICRRVMDAMGGSIKLVPSEQGCVMRLQLPPTD